MGRLGEAVERELDALREEFTDDLLLTMLLLDAGEVDEASHMVDSQSDRLRRFRERVDDAVASAAVEREAERVVATAGSVPEEPRRAPALATAAFAAASGFVAVLAILAGPGTGPDHVAGAALERVRTQHQLPVHPDLATAGEQRSEPTARFGRSVEREVLAAEPGSGLDVLRLIGAPGRLLADLADGTDETPLAALLDVDGLVRKLAPEIEALRAREEPSEGAAADSEAEEPAEEPSGEEAGPSEEEAPPVGGEPAPPTEPDDPESESEGGSSEEPSEDEGPTGILSGLAV